MSRVSLALDCLPRAHVSQRAGTSTEFHFFSFFYREDSVLGGGTIPILDFAEGAMPQSRSKSLVLLLLLKKKKKIQKLQRYIAIKVITSKSYFAE